METTARELIQATDRERQRRRMSDRKFSMQVLGISPGYFCLLKAGKRPVTSGLVVILLRRLPEVSVEAMNFIERQGHDGDKEQ